MQSADKSTSNTGAVPLLNAVLCVECQCITVGRLDRCSVCGSPSLMSVARLVGGPQPCEARNPREKTDVPRFDAGITIELRQGQPGELTAAVESIVKVLAGWLASGRATCHVEVVPVVESVKLKKAA